MPHFAPVTWGSTMGNSSPVKEAMRAEPLTWNWLRSAWSAAKTRLFPSLSAAEFMTRRRHPTSKSTFSRPAMPDPAHAMESKQDVTWSGWGRVALFAVVCQGLLQYGLVGPGLDAPWRTAAVYLCAVAYLGLPSIDRIRTQVPAIVWLGAHNSLALALPWLSLGHASMAPLAAISLNGLVLSGGAALLAAIPHAANVLAANQAFLPVPASRQADYVFVVAVFFVIAFTRAVASEVALRSKLATASRRLSAQADQAQKFAAMAERERIARDVHDSVGHALVTAHLHVRLAERDLDHSPLASASALDLARTALQTGLEDLRATVRALNVPEDQAPCVATSIRTLIMSYGGPELATSFELRGSLTPLPAHACLSIYRVAQESLTNVVKHAQASRVRVELDFTNSDLMMRIADNGVGLSSAMREGFGLAGIRARIQILGGQLALRHDDGLVLEASVPLPNQGA